MKHDLFVPVLVILLVITSPLISLAQVTEPTAVWSLDWSPDGTQVALFGDGIWIYDQNLSSGRHIDTDATGVISWSPDGTKLAAGNEIWDVEKMQRITTIDTEVSLGGLAKSWSNDSTQIVNAGYRGKDIAIFDANTGDLLQVIPVDRLTRIQGIDWSPDDSQFVVSLIGRANAIAFINIQEKRITAYYPIKNFPGSVTWNPDGKRIAILGSREVEQGTPGSIETAGGAVLYSVQIWDMTTGTILSFNRLPDYPSRLRWRPDGEELAGGTANGSVFVWNIPKRELEGIFLSAGSIYDISYSPLGGRLAIASSPTPLEYVDPKFRISTVSEQRIFKSLSNNLVEIAIPSPSLETLKLIASQCFSKELNAIPNSIGEIPHFLTQLPELSDEMLSAGCKEELELVANAVLADQ